MVLAFILCLVLLLWFRRRQLGPALLAVPPRTDWLPYLYLALFALSAAALFLGWTTHLDVVGLFFAMALLSFLTRGFSIHPHGIACGATIIPWSKLEGWTWESPSQQLILWFSWSLVILVPARSPFRCQTGQFQSRELEALLQRFAPEGYRSPNSPSASAD